MKKTIVFAMVFMACSLSGLLIYRILPNSYGLTVSVLFAILGMVTGLMKTAGGTRQEPSWRRSLREMFSAKRSKSGNK